jgi:hypothetical protein
VKTKRHEFTAAIALLSAFAIWFGFDLYTEKRFLNHPEYVHYYFAFRQWFLKQLTQGNFPIWNPFWGIGHSAEIEASFPVDIYSLFELIWGPRYSSYQLVQLFFLFGAALGSAILLGFSPLIGAAGTVLFFLSPWVTYFFFYFIKTNTFIGLLLSLALAWRLSLRPSLAWASALAFTIFFSLFGTKVDFWFLSLALIGIFGLFCAYFLPRETRKQFIVLHYGAMVLAISCHLWQIVPLVQILRQADRLGDPPGLSSLASRDFYFRLLLSVVSSAFLKTLLIAYLVSRAFSYKGRKRAFFGGLALALFGVTRLWAQPPFLFLEHPFLLAGMAVVALMIWKDPKNRKRALTPFLLFLPLSIYWCRPIPGDLNELTVMRTAPWLFPFVSGALVQLGLFQIHRERLVQVCLLSIFSVFLLRDQGQVIMAHLWGIVWIPTRDSFLIDALLAIIAMQGLTSLPFPKIAAAVTFCVVVLSASANFYYSHPLIEKTPQGFPYYLGVSEIREAIKPLRTEPSSRIFFLNPNVAHDLRIFGASLSEEIGQAHAFSSFMPKRYHDWSVYHWFGIRPEEKWSAYEGEYTASTIEKLPPRETKGAHNNRIYWWALHAMPPAKSALLRLLGIEYAISDEPIGAQATLFDIQQRGKYWTARIKDPLPRAFWLPAIAEEERENFSKNLEPKLEDITQKLQPVSITHYSPSAISLEMEATKEADVILTDLYHPFWKAKVDGKSSPISPALHLFRSVRVPQGKHRIDFSAEIPGWWTAVIASAIAFSLLLASALYSLFFNPQVEKKKRNAKR